jgi:hypothetical protein
MLGVRKARGAALAVIRPMGLFLGAFADEDRVLPIATIDTPARNIPMMKPKTAIARRSRVCLRIPRFLMLIGDRSGRQSSPHRWLVPGRRLR